MIGANQICEIAKMQKVVSLKWVSKEGELICVDKAAITSFHGAGMTFNIKILSSGEVRSVNRLTVVELNGEEVFV